MIPLEYFIESFWCFSGVLKKFLIQGMAINFLIREVSSFLKQKRQIDISNGVILIAMLKSKYHFIPRQNLTLFSRLPWMEIWLAQDSKNVGLT